jgi:hypothetical protein
MKIQMKIQIKIQIQIKIKIKIKIRCATLRYATMRSNQDKGRSRRDTTHEDEGRCGRKNTTNTNGFPKKKRDEA